jgi:hypothetical protein
MGGNRTFDHVGFGVPNRYFRTDWRHSKAEYPIVIWDEVADDGAVLRRIDQFHSTPVRCEAVTDYEGREQDLPGIASLIPEHWDRATEGMTEEDIDDAEPVTLRAVAAQKFERLWRRHRERD